MNLNYKARMLLIDMAKQEKMKTLEECIKTDAKFKGNDPSMRNDKEKYFLELQEQNYNKLDLLNHIINQLETTI